MTNPEARKPVRSLGLARYPSGRVECDLDPAFIDSIQNVAAVTNDYNSFAEMIERNPDEAYDFLRRAIYAYYIKTRENSDVPTPSFLAVDGATIYDAHSGLDNDYDPTGLADKLIMDNMLPDRYTSDRFLLSIGTPTTEYDRKFLGPEAERIELFEITVGPNNYA